MKNTLLLIAGILFLTSCSQQKFAFRKKLSVDRCEQQVFHPSHKNKPALVDQKGIISESQQTLKTEELTLVDYSMVSAANDPSENISIEKEKPVLAAQPVLQQKTVSKSTVPQEQQKTMGDRGTLAIIGFILSLLGLFVAAVPFGILAIIFGAISLNSSKKGWAIASIIIGFIDVFVGLILISRMST